MTLTIEGGRCQVYTVLTSNQHVGAADVATDGKPQSSLYLEVGNHNLLSTSPHYHSIIPSSGKPQHTRRAPEPEGKPHSVQGRRGNRTPLYVISGTSATLTLSLYLNHYSCNHLAMSPTIMYPIHYFSQKISTHSHSKIQLNEETHLNSSVTRIKAHTLFFSLFSPDH